MNDWLAAANAAFAATGLNPIWLGWLAAALVLACLGGRDKGGGE
jgi:hypothetical protein